MPRGEAVLSPGVEHVVARPTKIRQAKSAEDYRDAVVERWRQIHRRAPRPGPAVAPDEPSLPPRLLPARRSFLPPGREPGRGVFDDEDD